MEVDKIILKAVFYFIGSLGGASLLIFSLSSFLGKIWSQKLVSKYKNKLEKDLQEIKKEHNKEIDNYKSKLDRTLEDYNRFSGKRFGIINETWSAVFRLVEDLKIYKRDKSDYPGDDYLLKDIQKSSEYLMLIEKNSLYFNDNIEKLLKNYLNEHSVLIGVANSQINKGNLKENFDDIFKNIIEGAVNRDKIRSEIKSEFKKELMSINL